MYTNDKGSKGYLFSIVLVAVIGGLLFGYDTAVISGAEKGLKAFLCTRNDCCIVSEKQSSNYSNKDYRKEIALAAFIIISIHHNLNFL